MKRRIRKNFARIFLKKFRNFRRIENLFYICCQDNDLYLMLESTIILSVLIVLMVFFLKEALSITLTKQETSPLDKPSSMLPLSEFFVNLFYINNLTIIPPCSLQNNEFIHSLNHRDRDWVILVF